jgi:homoserine acetyltransferase
MTFLRASHSEIATITYRSGPEWDIRFGRKLRESSEAVGTRTPALCPDFLIETYLDHQVRSSSQGLPRI